MGQHLDGINVATLGQLYSSKLPHRPVSDLLLPLQTEAQPYPLLHHIGLRRKIDGTSHPHVENERMAGIQKQEQELSATLRIYYDSVLHAGARRGWPKAYKVRVDDIDTLDPPRKDPRGQPPEHVFDVWQLRHTGCDMVRGRCALTRSVSRCGCLARRYYGRTGDIFHPNFVHVKPV